MSMRYASLAVYTVTTRFDEFERNSIMVVRKIMFSDWVGFGTVCLFVDWSVVFVKTVSK